RQPGGGDGGGAQRRARAGRARPALPRQRAPSGQRRRDRVPAPPRRAHALALSAACVWRACPILDRRQSSLSLSTSAKPPMMALAAITAACAPTEYDSSWL